MAVDSILMICIEPGRYYRQHLVIPRGELDAPENRDQSFWGDVFVKSIFFEDLEAKGFGTRQSMLEPGESREREGFTIREVQLLSEDEFEQLLFDWTWI